MLAKIRMLWVLIVLIFYFSQDVFAKTVYIAWMQQFGFYPITNQLVSINIENGAVIQSKEFIGSDFSSINIDSQESFLYVSDPGNSRILKVRTSDFSIFKQWDNLPAWFETIYLNEANNNLYFTNTRSAGTGSDVVYQIDLNSDIVSATNLIVNGLDVQGIYSSKDNSVVVFKAYNIVDNMVKFYSYDTSQMQLIAESLDVVLYKTIFDNDGIRYYGYNLQSNSIEAYRMTDGNQLWSTPLNLVFPIHFILDKNNDSIVLIDDANTYAIDKNNGTVSMNPDLSMLDSTVLVEINYPSIWCITGFCSLGSNLKISQYLLSTNNFIDIFESTQAAGAQDFVFGNAILSSTQIPILNKWWLLILILILLIVAGKYRITPTRQ